MLQELKCEEMNYSRKNCKYEKWNEVMLILMRMYKIYKEITLTDKKIN